MPSTPPAPRGQPPVKRANGPQLLNEVLPPGGVKIIVRGVYLGGSFTPVGDGGLYATFHGLTGGYLTFQGRTSDYGFISRDLAAECGATWEPDDLPQAC